MYRKQNIHTHSNGSTITKIFPSTLRNMLVIVTKHNEYRYNILSAAVLSGPTVLYNATKAFLGNGLERWKPGGTIMLVVRTLDKIEERRHGVLIQVDSEQQEQSLQASSGANGIKLCSLHLNRK